MRILGENHIGIRPLGNHMLLIKRSIALFFLMDFAWRWYSHLMVSQFEGNQMINISRNLTFHIYKMSGMQNWLVLQPLTAILFDLTLVVSFILVFIFPQKRPFTYLAFGFFLLYSFIFPINLSFSAHFLCGMVFTSFALLAQKPKNFEMVWDGLRYYVCYVYFIAGVYKIINGVAFDFNAGSTYMRQNLAQHLYLNPHRFSTVLYGWLVNNPNFVNVASYFAYLLELFFVVGFFTKKFDRFLLWNIVILHLMLYVGVDTLFVEWFVFMFVFCSVAFWKKLSEIQLTTKTRLLKA